MRRDGGFALVLVLILVVILSAVVFAVSIRTSGGYRLARSRTESWRLYFAGVSAIEEAKAAVRRDAMTGTQGTRGFIYGLPRRRETDVDGVKVTVDFADEAGKIPVNNFVTLNDAGQKELALDLARLFDLLSLPGSTSLATALRDFVDTDSEGQRESAAKNAALFHPSELLAMQGFDYRTLYEPAREGMPAAADILTTFYTGKVNVNTAAPVVLLALEPSLTEADVQTIIAARDERPFTAAADLATRSGLSSEGSAMLARKTGFTTDTLTLYVEAREGAFVRRLRAVVWVESSSAHTIYIQDGWDL